MRSRQTYHGGLRMHAWRHGEAKQTARKAVVANNAPSCVHMRHQTNQSKYCRFAGFQKDANNFHIYGTEHMHNSTQADVTTCAEQGGATSPWSNQRSVFAGCRIAALTPLSAEGTLTTMACIEQAWNEMELIKRRALLQEGRQAQDRCSHGSERCATQLARCWWGCCCQRQWAADIDNSRNTRYVKWMHTSTAAKA